MRETLRDYKFTNRRREAPVSIGGVIMLARKIRRLKADEVAKHCNVSRGRVYQWERQTYILPKNLRNLAEVLHVPLEMLEAANGSRGSKKRAHCLKKHIAPSPHHHLHNHR